MFKDGKYRFNLTLPVGKDAEMVGLVLENLGHKKSQYIVFAMMEYLENHPELKEEWLRNEGNHRSVGLTPEVSAESEMVSLITQMVLAQLKMNNQEFIKQILASNQLQVSLGENEEKPAQVNEKTQLKIMEELDEDDEDDDENTRAMLSAFSSFF